MAKVAIMGFGTVGSGVGEVLTMNAASIAARAGEAVELKYVLDIREFPGSPFEPYLIHDFAILEQDPEVTVVAECMGGIGVAKSFTERCLKAGKSVVTSNKQLVATYGDELFELARQNHVNYLYEASVGGGIPLIRPIGNCLAANEITEIFGILNGTTNYILTKMLKEGTPFDQALKEAQARGYAELDPTADIEGHDACRKIAILASLVGGKQIDPDSVFTIGITGITYEDTKFAAAAGRRIKLLGRLVRGEDQVITAYVAPHLLKEDFLLANVDDVFNGVVVRGNAVGEVLLYGPGAGKLPTASAVAADMIDAVKHREKLQKLDWLPGGVAGDFEALQLRWYVRTSADVKTVESALDDVEVITEAELPGQVAVLTGEMSHAELTKRLMGIETLTVLPLLD